MQVGYEKSRFSTNISLYLGYDTRQGHSCCERQYEVTRMWSTKWCYFHLPWMIIIPDLKGPPLFDDEYLVRHLYANLCFCNVLKCSLSAHRMQVKKFLSLVIWIADCMHFCQKTAWTNVNFLTFWFLKPNPNRFSVFRTPLEITPLTHSVTSTG